MQAIPIQHITKGYVMRSGYKTNEWYRAAGRYGWVRLHEITIKSGIRAYPSRNAGMLDSVYFLLKRYN